MSIEGKKFLRPEIRDKIEDTINDAASMGISYIELLHVDNDVYKRQFIGVEELVIRYVKNGPAGTMRMEKHWIKDGELNFNPDKKGRLWGYIADTEANRKFLASMLCQRDRFFVIVDAKINGEVFDLAKKLGYGVDIISVDPMMPQLYKKNPVLKEKDDLSKRIAELESELAKAKSVKPLSGVRLDRTKLGTKGTVGDENAD